MVSMAEEDVFLWFRHLPSYQRIEALCQMFNLCVPLELRFIETYLTKLLTREALILKDHEIRANSVTEMKKFTNQESTLFDGPTRSRLVISLALLKGESSETSKMIYTILTKGFPEDKSSFATSDIKCLEELVLLFSMAALHPAFTYGEQTILGEIKSELVTYVPEDPKEAPEQTCPTSLNGIPTQTVNVGVQSGQFYTYPVPIMGSVLPPFQWCPPPQTVPIVPQGLQSQNSTANSHKLCLVAMSNPGPSNPQKYNICGTFSDGRQIHVAKDVLQIASLRSKLQSSATTTTSGNNVLPPLSPPTSHQTSQLDGVPKEIRDFFEELCNNYGECEAVLQFFEYTQQQPLINGITRFIPTAGPPPVTHYSREMNEVQNALRTANVKKYIPKFTDVVTMNDFCELSPESLKARGLSIAAIGRVQKIQAQNGSMISPTSHNGHTVANVSSANWHSSEDDSTPPSSSPSPPTNQQYQQPYYGIMMPAIVQQGTTFPVPTNYTGYHLPTYVQGPHQPTGAYVTQGVQTGSQHMVSPLLVHSQHNGVAHPGPISHQQTQQIHNGHNGAVHSHHHHHHHHIPHTSTNGVHQSRETTPALTKSEQRTTASSCKTTASSNHQGKFHGSRGNSPLVSVGDPVTAGENGHN